MVEGLKSIAELLNSDYTVDCILCTEDSILYDMDTSTIEVFTLSPKELQKISGLGVKKAQAIIDYREVNGPFTDVKQLLNVKGIGEKFLLKNGKSLRL